MKKILFPVDFSKPSLNAFSYALHLADSIHAEIVTVHQYEIPRQNLDDLYPFLYVNYGITDLNEFESFKSSVPSLNIIAETHHMGHIKLSHMLRQGAVADGILAAAEEENPDYIVMGTHGASGVREVLFGSVAEKIVNAANVPVLTIPNDCVYRDAQKILFLTQFSEIDVKIVDQVIRIATLFKAHTDVLEVRANHKINEAKMLRNWQAQYPQTDIRFNIVVDADTEAAVLKFITQNKIDMVVLTVAHKGFFEKLFFYSLSRRMTFHSVIPVLSIPLNWPGEKAAAQTQPQSKKALND